MNPRVSLILERVGAATGMSVAAILSRRRARRYVDARLTAVALIGRFTTLSDDAIAQVVKRERSAVSHYRALLQQSGPSDSRNQLIEDLARELAPLVVDCAGGELETMFDRIRIAWRDRPLDVQDAVAQLIETLPGGPRPRRRPETNWPAPVLPAGAAQRLEAAR